MQNPPGRADSVPCDDVPPPPHRRATHRTGPSRRVRQLSGVRHGAEAELAAAPSTQPTSLSSVPAKRVGAKGHKHKCNHWPGRHCNWFGFYQVEFGIHFGNCP